MARPKRSSAILQKAEKRQASLQSISPSLDLGNNLTLTAYSTFIQTLRSQIADYNSALSNLDDFSRQIKDTEQQLRDLSEQMLLGVAVKYGKNSGEYGKAGGIPKGDRRRANRPPTKASGNAIMQPNFASPSPASPSSTPANGNVSTSVNSNGNGKVLVS